MKNLKNENGVALLQALMITVVVGISAGFILSQMRLTDNTLIIPRIRSEMLVAESAFRNMAYMSSVYWCDSSLGAVGCAPSGPASDALPTNAAISPGADPDIADSYLTEFESNLPSCSPAPCGIRYNLGGAKYTWVVYLSTAQDVTDGLYPLAGLTIYRISTRITYGTGPLTQEVAGKKISVAPVNITIDVPRHILTGAPFRCAAQNPTRPFFRGFQMNGTPVCTGWLGANQTNGKCSPGYFLSDFDAETMTITCRQLRTPLAGNACADANLMSNIVWNPGSDGNLPITCTARPNAFTYFSHNPYALVVQNP